MARHLRSARPPPPFHPPTNPDPAPQFVEAVLVASGGMPHPGPEAIAAAAAHLSAQDRNYDGTTTATDAAAKKPESKETLLCRAIDKKLVAFW